MILAQRVDTEKDTWWKTSKSFLKSVQYIYELMVNSRKINNDSNIHISNFRDQRNTIPSH